MSFMRRSSSRPSSSRGCNKVRLTNKHEVAEIESWVDIISQNESDDDEQIRFQSLRKKNQKNMFMQNVKEWRRGILNHCINKHMKRKCLQNLEFFSMELCQDWINRIKF